MTRVAVLRRYRTAPKDRHAVKCSSVTYTRSRLHNERTIMQYLHSYYWEEPCTSCLAIEYVMGGAGPVIIGVLYDGSGGEETVRKVIGWFYEEALPIIRERGPGRVVKNTFLQKKAFRDERLKIVLMFRKKTILFPDSGRKARDLSAVGGQGILQISKREYLITSEDFGNGVSVEECYRFLGKDGIGDKDAGLQELGRRAKVRNRSGAHAAIYIGRD